MAGWLNDQHIALQVVVQIYGLLSPIMYWKYPIHAALEVTFLSIILCPDLLISDKTVSDKRKKNANSFFTMMRIWSEEKLSPTFR